MNVYCPKCGSKNDYFQSKRSNSCVKCKSPMFSSKAREHTKTVKMAIQEDQREFGDKIPELSKLDVDIEVIKARTIKLGELIPPSKDV